MSFIAYRFWSKALPTLYVSEAKENKGDWGYTTNPLHALKLSKKQVGKFSSYCKEIGVIPTFIKKD